MRAATPRPRALYENVNEILMRHFSCRPFVPKELPHRRCCRHVLMYLTVLQYKIRATLFYAGGGIINQGALLLVLCVLPLALLVRKCRTSVTIAVMYKCECLR